MARPRKRPETGDALERRPEIRVGGRWRLRNWRLRTKLIVVLVIPALTVLALIGLHVQQDLAHADDLAELSALGRVDAGVNDVIHQLQRERDLSVRFVAASREGDLTELHDQQAKVDASIGTVDKQFDADRSRLSGSGVNQVQATLSRLNVLAGLRYATEHSNLPADATQRSYSELISGMLDLSDQTVADVTDPELVRLRLAASALARVKDQMSVKRALLAEALQEGQLSSDELRALLGADAELSAARNDFHKFATPAEQRMYDDTVIGLIVDNGNNMVESAITRGEMGQSLSGLDPQQWDTAATYTINLAYQVQQALQSEMQTKIDSLATAARRSAITNAGVVLGVLVLCAVLAVIIARSLLRPLRALRRTALDVAEHRLPEAVENILADPHPEGAARRRGIDPVPVFSREELGQVARAFDAVHGQAVRLAGEQALLRENVNAMFVNLSRRSQDLVERQLSVLDRMEANEQDPETLGGLFELDHLATRMRRNSENLLVLSGHDLGDERAGPVPAEEIIGAALSEVEHYQRIELTAAPDLAIRGDATSDLVHVISELLENATLYSPPDTTVTVVSTVGDDGAWQVHITDSGAGMPEPEIQRANARLATPPDVDVEVSRRMGLFVVATLARRHDIKVRLRSADGGGLVATVLVPPALVVEQAPPLEPALLVGAAPEPQPWPVPAADAPLLLPQDATRRAPVEDEQSPDWPSEDNDEREHYYLDDDEPTERMPAYQAVLSQWFHTGEHWPVAGGDGKADVEPEWPEAESPGGSIAERLNGARHAQPEPIDPPTLRLDPEAVRGRMARLQDGFNRARQARTRGR